MAKGKVIRADVFQYYLRGLKLVNNPRLCQTGTPAT